MPHKRAKRSVRDADRFAKGHELPPGAATSKDAVSFGMPKGAMRILMGAQTRAEFQQRKRDAATKTTESKRIGADVPRRVDKGKAKASDDVAGSVRKDAKGRELKLLPGETLGNFNRRVEKTLAADINATMRAANSTSNKRKRGDGKDQADDALRIAGEQDQKERSAQKAAEKAALEPTSANLKRAREDLLSPGRQGGSATAAVDKDWAPVDQRRRINDVAQAPPRFTRLPKPRGAQAGDKNTASQQVLKPKRDAFEVDLPAEAVGMVESDSEASDAGGKKKRSKAGKGVARAVAKGRTAPSSSTGGKKASTAVAPVRERVLAKEREAAIERYRALKEARLQQKQAPASVA